MDIYTSRELTLVYNAVVAIKEPKYVEYMKNLTIILLDLCGQQTKKYTIG